MPSKTQTCPWCRRSLPVKRFYDPKNHKEMKVCYACLSKRRSSTKKKPYVNYKGYVRSAKWFKKRADYASSGRSMDCYICGAKAGTYKLEMHHRTYERLGSEHLDDLVPLCAKPCHAKVSAAWKKEKKKPKGKRRTLWEVTESFKKA